MSRIIIPGKSAHPDFALPGRQPRGFVEHPPEAIYSWIATSRDPRRTTVLTGATKTWMVNSGGICVEGLDNVADGGRISATTKSFIPGPYCVVFSVRPVSVPTGTRIIAELTADPNISGNAAKNPFFIFQTCDSSGNADTTQWAFGVYEENSGVKYGVVSIPAPDVGKVANFAVVFDHSYSGNGCVRAVFKNGIPQTLTGGLNTRGSTANPTATDLSLLARNTNLLYAPVGMYMFAILPSGNAGMAQRLSSDPYQLFRPANDPIFFIPSAAGTTITGTGSLAAGTASTSGTAEREVTGTGTAASGIATTSGTAEREITGTSSLASGAATTSGTAEREITGTSALASGAATTAGTAERGITGTSSLASGAATTSGTAEREITGTSALLSGVATTSGAGVMSRNATGTLLSEAATLEGVGTVGAPAKRHIRPATMLISGAATMAGEGEVIAA